MNCSHSFKEWIPKENQNKNAATVFNYPHSFCTQRTFLVDLEREVFTVGFETMLEELRILGIREEWMLQQKNLAELQDHICQVNRQISMHSTYRSTQGAVLGKLFNKIIAENGTMEQLIGEEVKWNKRKEVI